MQNSRLSQTLDLIKVLFNLNNVDTFGLIFLFHFIIVSNFQSLVHAVAQ